MPERQRIEVLLPWVAAAAGGVLTFLGYAGFDRFYLEWICLVPLLWAIREVSPGRAFLLGWVAGVVTHVGGFYWIVGMLQQFAGLSLPLAVAGLLLLAGANGLVFAFWGWGTRLVSRDARWSLAWVSPVVWIAVEKLWPELFPNYLGASQYRLVLLTQIADVTGILGLSFLVVYANSTAFVVMDRRLSKRRFPWGSVAAFAAVVGVALVYGAVRVGTVDRTASVAEKLTVGVVQTNRGAREKHDDPERFLREHQEASRALAAERAPDLLVWPESVCNLVLVDREGRLSPELLGDTRTPTLFGAALRQGQGEERREYNSAVLADGTGRILGIYDKTVLMPLGEYIPFGDRFPWLYSWSPRSGHFWPGSSEEPLLLGRHPLSVSICYEDIFPGFIRALMRGGRDHRVPEALFNLTNDSWYGDSVEPMEHLALASFRAIEHRRALVRATNTGISALVDPVGRLDLRTAQWRRQALVGQISLMEGRTVYAVLGDWVGWVCVVLSLLGLGQAILVARRRTEKAKAPASKGKKRRRSQRR